MAIDRSKIAIVGCGPGAADYVTEAAKAAIAEADVLVGSTRLLSMAADSKAETIAVGADIPYVLGQIARQADAGRHVAVLVSGDPGVYSLAKPVIDRFGREQCEVVPGISSVQVAFARLGLGWADARILSVHGREASCDPASLAALDKLAILAGTEDAMHFASVAAQATEASHAVFVCENLTLKGERIREMSAMDILTSDCSSLAIVVLIRRTLLT